MADRSAAALVDLLLEGSAFAKNESLTTLLAIDPPLVVWLVCQAGRYRAAWRPRTVPDLAQWLVQEADKIFSSPRRSLASPGEAFKKPGEDGEIRSEKLGFISSDLGPAQSELPYASQGMEMALKIQVEEDVFRAELAAQLAAAFDPALAEEAYFLGLLAEAERWISLSCLEGSRCLSEQILPCWMAELKSAPCQAYVEKARRLMLENPWRGDPNVSPSSASKDTPKPAALEAPSSSQEISGDFADFSKPALSPGGPDWNLARSRAAQAAWHWSHSLPGLPGRFPQILWALARVRELEQEFAESLERAKLEAMAELAAGAGHEINNPLAVIAGRAQLLLPQETDPERRRSLALIIAQVRRAYEMIADLRLFARPPRPQMQPVELSALVENLLADWAPLAGEQGICLIRTGHPGPLEIQADPTQLQVALRAVVQNAVEAVGRGGQVEIGLEEEAEIVRIRVTDNGPGIAPEVREHLFDPFYSARSAGRGLGLGLSKAWRIVVTNHHGQITVQSTPGQGTTFCLIFPKRAERIPLSASR